MKLYEDTTLKELKDYCSEKKFCADCSLSLREEGAFGNKCYLKGTHPEGWKLLVRNSYFADFREKFPNADLDAMDFYDELCVEKLYNKTVPDCCSISCVDCWNRLMEE